MQRTRLTWIWVLGAVAALTAGCGSDEPGVVGNEGFVCTVDGESHTLAEAAEAGHAIQFRGKCDSPMECTEDRDCFVGDVCTQFDEMQACVPTDTCVCPAVAMPVCGADGRTYGNACEASCVGVPVVHDGFCDEPPGTGCQRAGCSGQLCVEEGMDIATTCEWRDVYACYQQATCERQPNGQCSFTPTHELVECLDNQGCACPEYYSPVCGIDGNTYDNECFAYCRGVGVAHRGACGGNGCTGDYDCPPDQRCEFYGYECNPNQPCPFAAEPGADVPVYPGDGVCVPREGTCYDDADCGPGERCEYGVMPFAGNDEDSAGVVADPIPPPPGYCVPNGQCYGDYDCGPGYRCVWDQTFPGDPAGAGATEQDLVAYPGHCEPDDVCFSDGDCPAGERCEYFYPPPCDCGVNDDGTMSGGACPCPLQPPDAAGSADAGAAARLIAPGGYCVPGERYCWSDFDCLPGEYCDPTTFPAGGADDAFAPPAPTDAGVPAPPPEGVCRDSCALIDCAPGYYCERGQCLPLGCPDIWDPVCGTNGRTYGNGCEAESAGVGIRFRGTCESETCFTLSDAQEPDFAPMQCPPNEYCLPIGCGADGTCEAGVCRPQIPCDCVVGWDPLCGVDGVTYANACEAGCLGASILREGPCAAPPPGCDFDPALQQGFTATCETSALGETRVEVVPHSELAVGIDFEASATVIEPALPPDLAGPYQAVGVLTCDNGDLQVVSRIDMTPIGPVEAVCRDLRPLDVGHCNDIPECDLQCPAGTHNPVDENGCVHTCECVPDEPNPCHPTGCSGQVCAGQDIDTTCEWRPEYICYQQAGVCELQPWGECAWTRTQELDDCLSQFDCRSQGCDEGSYCDLCWTEYACIPDGAVC